MTQYILMLRQQVENLLEKIRPQWRAQVSHRLSVIDYQSYIMTHKL